MLKVFQGKILYVNDKEVWKSFKLRLFVSYNSGETWFEKGRLPIEKFSDFFTLTRITSRLLRSEYHYFLKTENQNGIVLANKSIYSFENNSRLLTYVSDYNGSRPLSLELINKSVQYGEYGRNPKKKTMSIWKLDKNKIPQRLWSFDSVRHVHGVYFDQITKFTWVTTGDTDDESAIWLTKNNFKTIEKVVGGAQCYRAVKLLFTEKYIYFGSDSPNEINQIYRLNRKNYHLEPLVRVGGPIFFGYQINKSLFFSTAVEPSKVNTSKFVEVWGSKNGVNWNIIYKFKKDCFPLRVFQYGHVTFPSGPGDNTNLWFTQIATKDDYTSTKVPISSINF